MQTVSDCPACGTPNPSTIAQLDEFRRQVFLKFDQIKYGGLLAKWIDTVSPQVLGCRVCGHAWYRHQPEPDQLSLMYAAGRPLEPNAVHTNVPSIAMQQEMRKIRRLTNTAPEEPLLLDYGSGRGRWARAAVSEGFRVVAYEPSVERGGESAPPFLLLHSEFDLEGMQFDVINLEQVLEHVPDPLETLTRLKAYCRPQTLIRITVPNIMRDPSGSKVWESWPFDGKTPHVLAPFEHLHGFTPSSLRILCIRAGYRPVAAYRIARTHPLNLVRRWIDVVWPSLGTTAQYLSLHS